MRFGRGVLPAACVDRKPLTALPFRLSSEAVPRVSKTPKPQPPESLEAALAELEKIVSTMEAGQLPLERSLAAYKRGAELLKYCQAALQDAQQQVKILENGILRDFKSDNRDDE
jgi:exodeoxyribonuclease VII small subunit